MRLHAEATAVQLVGDSINFSSEPGDPGVYVPDAHLGGAAYFGVSDAFEIGAHLQYTHASMADANAPGVLPLPAAQDRSLWSGGVGLRVNVPVGGADSPGSISFLGELNLTDLPQAIYVCEVCAEPGFDEAVDAAVYELDSAGRESFFVPNLAVSGGAWLADVVFLDVIAGLTTSVTNVGFEEDLSRRRETTLSGFLVGYVGMGAELRFKPFVAGLHIYWPLEGEDELSFGLLGNLQLGVIL